MKTKILITGFALGAVIAQAQNSGKPATVHIKKIENINGVEKVTDTTFTTTDPSTLTVNGARVRMLNEDSKDGKAERVILAGDDINPDDAKVIGNRGEIDKEIEEALMQAGIDPAKRGDRKVVIVRDDMAPGENNKSERKVTRIVMMRSDISNVSESDRKRLSRQIGDSDDKLEVEKMSLYPNPADGKFNLKFDLKTKADAEVTVYDTNGKQVYSEKLPGFSGEYNKPIDISQNSKGVYFVKVMQGKHSMVKKIVME